MSQFHSFLFWYWESKTKKGSEKSKEDFIQNKIDKYTSSIGNPFKFFKWFFYGDGYSLFVEYFKTYPIVFNYHPASTEQFREEDSTWVIKYESDSGEINSFNISLNEELKELFTFEIEHSEYLLEKINDKIANVSEKNLSISTYLDEAEEISIKNISKSNIGKKYIVLFKQYFHEFASFIQDRRDLLQNRKSPSSRKSKTKKNFGIEGNKKNDAILDAIHGLNFDGYSFIDRIRTKPDTFKEYFYCNDLTNSTVRIYINCQVKQAVYVIRKIKEKVFRGLAFRLIDKSKGIMKSDPDHITEDDLYTSHIGVNYTKQFQKEVNEFFDKLLLQKR